MSTQTEIVTLEIMPAEIQLATKQLGLPLAEAGSLFAPFAPLYADASALLTESKAINKPKAAREMRLKLVKARTAIAKAKDAAKADILRNGKAIDGFNNIAKAMMEPEEERLEAIEKEEERAIAAAKEKMKADRSKVLAELGVDSAFYNLGEMPEAAFVQLVEQTKLAAEAKAKAEAEAKEAARVAAEKAEADRVAKEKADREERERMAAENARLKAERDAAEAAAKVERERVAKEAAEAAAKAKAEREAIEAKAKAEREEIERKAAQERALAEAAAKVERAKREALELAERERVEANAKRQADEAKAAKKAAAAPDRNKLETLAEFIGKIQVPEMKSEEGKAAAQSVVESLAKFSAHVKNLASKL